MVHCVDISPNPSQLLHGALRYMTAVASLELLSPGAATDSVIFFLKKLATFFWSSLSLLLISLGCHPLKGVTRGGPSLRPH